MRNSEEDFIHDIVNKLTMVRGKVHRIVAKSENFTKEQLKEMAMKAESELDAAFEIIDARKKTLW